MSRHYTFNLALAIRKSEIEKTPIVRMGLTTDLQRTYIGPTTSYDFLVYYLFLHLGPARLTP